MTVNDFNRFCSSLPLATYVVQWGGAHVWKVAGKVFAIGGWSEGAGLGVSFKCSAIAFEALKDHPGVRPAPYLASRGMTWLQRTSSTSMTDAALKDAVRESHRLVALGLSKRIRNELGLIQTGKPVKNVRRSSQSQLTAKSPKGTS
jgi:predicted DNA-binding protein (MmcQ/YjbR family)